MNKELLIANDYYVLVKLEPELVKVTYPANIIAQPERQITKDYYIYNNGIMGINGKASKVPDYIPRVLTFMNIQYKAIGYGFDPTMVLKDNYDILSVLDIPFKVENLDLEHLLRNNIQHVVKKRLDLVPDEIKEGCEFLFNCFYNGDL